MRHPELPEILSIDPKHKELDDNSYFFFLPYMVCCVLNPKKTQILAGFNNCTENFVLGLGRSASVGVKTDPWSFVVLPVHLYFIFVLAATSWFCLQKQLLSSTGQELSCAGILWQFPRCCPCALPVLL